MLVIQSSLKRNHQHIELRNGNIKLQVLKKRRSKIISKFLKSPEFMQMSEELREAVLREIDSDAVHGDIADPSAKTGYPGLYDVSDLDLFIPFMQMQPSPLLSLQTLDELLQRDKQREADGFPRRIRVGKFIKPVKGEKEKIVVVPTTTEPKFYHDPDASEEGESTGGSGEGEEGEVIGREPAEPQEGEGEGQGAGQGEGAEHDILTDAMDLGKVLTQQFQLPNLRTKGKKRAVNKYEYDLTDRHRGFGQILDKKATIRKIIETNILLGNIPESGQFDPQQLVINPQDKIYRILSKEKTFESQAVVFLIRDYSGSMQGKPTEAVVTQHLLIYSWLMYQYQGLVQVRFILHDTESKEVPDFYTYYKSAVAGGTSVYPSYQLVREIIEKEQLARDYNIYIFHGTDGDDWEEHGEKAIDELQQLIKSANRIGITVAKNSWTSPESPTIIERYIEKSELLIRYPELIRMDSFVAADVTEERLVEGIRKLIQ
jgi:uncharacterized sporulation protein YeaH/YhbH (DUF444 family)